MECLKFTPNAATQHAHPSILGWAAFVSSLGSAILIAGCQERSTRSPDGVVVSSTAIGVALNAVREEAGLRPLVLDETLQTEAQSGAESLATSLEKASDHPITPDPLAPRRIKAALPATAYVCLEAVRAESAERVAERVENAKAGHSAELTHLGVGVCEGTLGAGNQFWVVVVIGCRLLPIISPESVNQGQREFELRCSGCRYRGLVRLRQSSEGAVNCLMATCPNCRCPVDLYGIDSLRRYHRPSSFMRRFRPKQIDRPLDAWMFVLQDCRYIDDRKQYGATGIWQTAEETYRLRHGDCKDSAILLADWLAACGYDARVVIGQLGGRGHAWVVLHLDGHDYILETTGGWKTCRRMPPRAELMTSYLPQAQFDGEGAWFRTSTGWTADYRGKGQWSRGPWPTQATRE